MVPVLRKFPVLTEADMRLQARAPYRNRFRPLRLLQKYIFCLGRVRAEGEVTLLLDGKPFIKNGRTSAHGLRCFQEFSFSSADMQSVRGRRQKAGFSINFFPEYTTEELDGASGQATGALSVSVRSRTSCRTSADKTDPCFRKRESYSDADFIQTDSQEVPEWNRHRCSGGVDTTQVNAETLESISIKDFVCRGNFWISTDHAVAIICSGHGQVVQQPVYSAKEKL